MTPYYEHKGITIYHGDCREVIPALPPPAIDLIVSDPPYGIGWKISSIKGGRAHAGIAGDDDTSVRDAALALLAGKPGVVFGSFYAPYPRDLRQVLVWHKPLDSGVIGSVTGYRRDAEPIFLIGPWPQLNVERSSVLQSGYKSIAHVIKETGHPHTKPIDLLIRLICAAPGGVICDPFAGSGSTLVAAKSAGRKAIGIELEEKYCEIAAKRLDQEVMEL